MSTQPPRRIAGTAQAHPRFPPRHRQHELAGAQVEFHISIGAVDGVVTVTVAGELDAGTAVDCTDRINGHRLDGDTKSVVLDLRDITFIDAAGLRALAEARDRLSLHGQVRVANAPRVVSRLTEILGVDLDHRREV